MNDNKITELMNKEIDDLISSEEKMKLHEYLDNNPEAMVKYQNLIQSVKIFDKIEEVQPPEYLKSQIMNSIDPDRYSEKQKEIKIQKIQFLDWLFYPKPKLAFVFTIGIIFGLLAYALFIKTFVLTNQIDQSELIGTIGIDKNSGIQNITSFPISIESVSGKINVMQHNRLIWFDIKLETKNEVDLLLDFEKNTFNFKNYNNDRNIQAGDDYVKTKLNMDNHLILFFIKQIESTSSIDIKMYLSGGLRFSKKIKIN